ncbi:MAG: hypothetical protein FWH04_08775 [Oscillospiraceae bacterium]|nr:hypothetical protein [Oscillospiraceae bacterium]
MLWNAIKLECKKAILNKLFLAVILIGCTITMFSLIPCLRAFYRDMNFLEKMSQDTSVLRNPMMPLNSLFNHWIGSEAITPGSTDYFFLFPLLIAIPYGWSYCAEQRSGYIKNMVIRSGRWQYHLSKYIALFLSGGLAMVIPLLFNFLTVAMFVPAVTPDPHYITGYGIISSSFLSELFYTKPFLYVFLYLAIDFIYCGLIACLCFSFATVIKNRAVVVLLPFFVLLGFNYVCSSFIYTSSNVVYTELSPMNFLRPVGAYDTNGFVVSVGIAILFTITFSTTVVRGGQSEIY